MNTIIVFDTETTGFSPEKNEIVQLSYILYNIQTQSVIYATSPGDDIVNIKGNIPKVTSDVHGITKDMTLDKQPIKTHIDQFIGYCEQAGTLVGHNIKFDIQMITGQIHKIISEFPSESERYSEFLKKFAMVGSKLPNTAYCTMTESQGICAQLKGTKKLKNEKLMEVHKLLFNQDVGGQLHNALVDISVTLRVYLKLTLNVDICQTIDKINTAMSGVKNNNEICNLINPINIQKPEQTINYSGDLITGITKTPRGLVEETINVASVASKMAAQLVSNMITVCSRTITSTEISNDVCDNDKKIDLIEIQREKPIISKMSQNFVSNLMQPFTRKNKVVPLGGRRKALRKRKSRKIKKYRKRT